MNFKRVRYLIMCNHFKTKIREIELERLGEAWERIISYNSQTTFEDYVCIWKSRGYKII